MSTSIAFLRFERPGLLIAVPVLISLFAAMSLIPCETAYAEDLIVRASAECCKQHPNFESGSKAVLMDGEKILGTSQIESEAPFRFKDVEPGKYDLLVSVVGYYPIKFSGVEIGEGGVYDFELIADLKPLTANLLEGQIVIRFKKQLSDDEILKRLDSWKLGVQQLSRIEPGSKPPQHVIERMYGYSEVRASYDRSRKLRDIMSDILNDPAVIECTPLYF
ncbi:MAG: hypothetical protein ABIK83_11120 [Candidatus Zixiibacteriota bacterium]